LNDGAPIALSSQSGTIGRYVAITFDGLGAA
jgi:hypothetical protein